MQHQLTKEKKLQVAKEIQKVMEAPIFKNTEKLKMIEKIVLRVTTEQKEAYKNLVKETKIPLSKIVRNSLNTIVKHKYIKPKKPLTPQEQKDNFTSFQKQLGLI
jgi:hypothetical protein